MYITKELQLYDTLGNRKYLNEGERKQFYKSSLTFKKEVRLFCLMFFWTGGRISEILNLKVTHIDFYNQLVIIESLKRRKKGMFRQIPLPSYYLKELKIYVHDKSENDNVWGWSRSTGSRNIKKVMSLAKIVGIQACPKGLRHSFAIHCVTNNIPITLVQKWLGHKSISTTLIYLDIVGIEERKLAERIWDK